MPGLNTAALPDLIFTVLFFFMIVTHMRDVEPLVRYDVPLGTELQKVAHKASVVYIYVGRTAKDSDQFAIQLNNRLAIETGIVLHQRKAVNKTGMKELGMPTKYQSLAPMLSIKTRPWRKGPLFTFDYERGLPGKNYLDYERWEIDASLKHRMHRLQTLNPTLSATKISSWTTPTSATRTCPRAGTTTGREISSCSIHIYII